MFKAAAVILPLVTLSYLSVSQQEKLNTVYAQMTNLNPFSSLLIEERTPLNETELEIEPAIIEITKNKLVKPTKMTPTSKSYYIIAGAFAEQKNADKMIAKLSRWNYNPELVDGGKLLRVSYDSFTNREDAIIALNKIRKDNKSAWLLTK